MQGKIVVAEYFALLVLLSLAACVSKDAPKGSATLDNLMDRADDGVLWTVEVFYTCPGDPYFRWPERFAKAMETCLTEEHRVAILSIKEALQRQEEHKDSKSFDIYRGVLEGGIRSFPAYLKWLERNKTQGIVPWVPEVRDEMSNRVADGI